MRTILAAMMVMWLQSAVAGEMNIRNFVEPEMTCDGSTTTPARSVVLPPDIPDGTKIVGATLSNSLPWNSSIWGNNSTPGWVLALDPGGKYKRVSGYPTQDGTFYQLNGLAFLSSPAQYFVQLFNPPLVYHTGDFIILNFVCFGGGTAFPGWNLYLEDAPVNTIYAYGPTTVSGDGGAGRGTSVRNLTYPIHGAWTQVRVTFLGGDQTGLACQNVSVGVRSSGTNTTATPVELLYGGVHGFNKAGVPATLAVSDWGTLSFGNGDVLVVTCDMSSTVTSALSIVNTGVFVGPGVWGSPGSYYKVSAQSYNMASPSGFSAAESTTYGLYSVEVQ